MSVGTRTWRSTGPLIFPIADVRHPIVSVKDPAIVHDAGRWHVFATTADTNGAWSMMYFNFTDWSGAGAAKPTMTVDPKNLQPLQGTPHGVSEPAYLLIPHRLALLKPAPAPPAIPSAR